jgi:hypothetical protein
MSSRGARSEFAKSIALAALDLPVKSAVDTSQMARAGAGMANSSCHRSDSAREIVFAKT